MLLDSTIPFEVPPINSGWGAVPETDVLFCFAVALNFPVKHLVGPDVLISGEAKLFYDEYQRGGYGTLSEDSRAFYRKLITTNLPTVLLEIDVFEKIVQSVRARLVASDLMQKLVYLSKNGTVETIRAALIEAGQRLVDGIGGAQSLSDILRDVQQFLQQRAERYISVPFKNMRDYVSAISNEYVVVGARTSVGKTSFALDWIRRQKMPTYFLSLEMSRHAIATRYYAMIRGISYAEAVRRIQAEDVRNIENAHGVFINDSSRVTGEHLPLIFSEAASRGARILVLDYIQMLYMQTRSERRDLELARISSILRDLSKRYDMPVIVLAQLNRLVESRTDGKPRLSDLRDSGALEMDADIVLLLSRRESELTVNVAKNRNGRTGDFNLYFDKQSMKFYDEPYELHGF